jgi:hypothetical protein
VTLEHFLTLPAFRALSPELRADVEVRVRDPVTASPEAEVTG